MKLYFTICLNWHITTTSYLNILHLCRYKPGCIILYIVFWLHRHYSLLQSNSLYIHGFHHLCLQDFMQLPNIVMVSASKPWSSLLHFHRHNVMPSLSCNKPCTFSKRPVIKVAEKQCVTVITNNIFENLRNHHQWTSRNWNTKMNIVFAWLERDTAHWEDRGGTHLSPYPNH